jgi:hypothetical protein
MVLHGVKRRPPPKRPQAEPKERSHLAGEVGLSRLRKTVRSLPSGRGCWHCLGTCYQQFHGQESVIIQWRHLFLSLPREAQDCELGIMFSYRGGGWEHLLPMAREHPEPTAKLQQMPGASGPKRAASASHMPSRRPNQSMDARPLPRAPGNLEADQDSDGAASAATMPSAGSCSSERASWSSRCSVDTEPRPAHTSSSERADSASQASWTEGEEGCASSQPPTKRSRSRGHPKRSRRAKLSFAFLGKRVCQDLSAKAS